MPNYNLLDSDYKKILEYYGKTVPRSKRLLKKNAEDIMARKLCACIKKLGTSFEPRSIGICTRSVFKTRGLKRGTFKCRKQRKVEMTKRSRKGVSFANTRKQR
uniref:Uncharacterized protein n=1 Tax=viral metagenome TaxID=1070528 RepID=A0A6C0HC62_9ZZZZ